MVYVFRVQMFGVLGQEALFQGPNGADRLFGQGGGLLQKLSKKEKSNDGRHDPRPHSTALENFLETVN